MSKDLYVAFLRCSEEELQNPELSLDRQLHNCQGAVAKRGGRIVATYYEIETGTSRYDQRGKGTNLDGYRISIPRAGGLHDLVADAARVPRPFDFVICENINRLARNPAVTFTVEEQLRAAGVTLLCADEPFEESFGSILLRHINVGLARGYHFDLMRKTREGRQSGTRQGWHMGGTAAYGYQFSKHEHPNPHKRSRGLTRSRLDLDPVRAPVVRRIFDEYLYSPRGLDEICQLLNSDLDRFPAPVPTDPARRSGAWSRSSVWNILRNPKYTGFQVYNRRASRTRRGRRNDPDEWTWSTEPAHPAIVTIEEFRQVDAVAASKARSKRTNAPARPDPKPAHYLFHGMVRCDCGLRMRGCRRKQTFLYYQCQPSRLRGRPLPAGHPSGVYVAEAALLDGVTGFLTTAVYGPERASYWERVLAAADAPDRAAPARARAAELEHEVADLQARLRRQVLALEDEQTAAEARQPIAERIAELRSDIAERQTALAKLSDETPPPPDPAAVRELLATLPLYDEDLRVLSPARLRELMESLRLTISYDHKEHTAQIQITLAAAGEGDLQVVPLVCSGGRTRTYNLGLNRAPLCRLSYAGRRAAGRFGVRRARRDGTRAIGGSSSRFAAGRRRTAPPRRAHPSPAGTIMGAPARRAHARGVLHGRAG